MKVLNWTQEVFNVAVVAEETDVLHNLKDVPSGFAVLMGIICCVNLEYPQAVKCSFEFLQRVTIMATLRPSRIPEDLARDMILNGWDEEPIGGIDSGSDISDVEDPEYCPSGHVRPSETQSAPAEQDQPETGFCNSIRRDLYRKRRNTSDYSFIKVHQTLIREDQTESSSPGQVEEQQQVGV
ncbi:hypothetical protein MHYP_G00017040 [Metynnis hypsauchen]